MFKSKRRKIDKFFSQGFHFLKRLNYVRAAEIVRNIIQIDPENSLAHLLIADVYGEFRDWNNAVYHYKKCLGIETGNTWVSRAAFLNLGMLYSSNNNLLEAINCFHQCIEREPEEVFYCICLGRIYNKLHRYQDAVSVATEAIRIDREHGGSRYSEHHFILGVACYKLGDYGRAIVSLKRAWELSEGRFAASLPLGDACYCSERYNEAIFWLKRAVVSHPKDYFPATRLGVCYFNLGRYGEAIECLKKAVALEPNNDEAHYYLGLASGFHNA